MRPLGQPRRPRRTTSRVAGATALVGLLLAAAGPVAPTAQAAEELTWTRIGTGSTAGVSGLAPYGDGGWLVVRDVKLDGQPRLAVLSASGAVTNLAWPGTAPVDLEAVAPVPGVAGRYAVVTSGGAGTVVDVAGGTVTVVRSFTLPTGRNQNEGFTLVRSGTTTVAVWGNRGSSTSPGRLFAARFTVGTGTFGTVVRMPVTVPWPTTSVRHVSDVAVVAGRLVVSSASDPGDAGPFTGAVHDVGSLVVGTGAPRLVASTPQELLRDGTHKIEAIGCPGVAGAAGLLGSDDERAGGWVAPTTSVCG